MFNFLRKKQVDSSENQPRSGDPIITAVLLDGKAFPVDAFLSQAAHTRIAGNAVSEISRNDKDTCSFNVGDELFALAVMPAPYPAADLEGPIATNWMWPPQPPIETVKQHRSHLLIAMMGGAANPVQRRLTMTAATALAAKQAGVTAVYWPEAALLIYPRLFVSMAERIKSPQCPPLYLWVNLRMFRNKDGTIGLFTNGLAPLGHMEIEIPRIDMKPADLREWLLSIMYYLLENGPVLEDGQTIGMSAEQKINIRHCPSRFGHPGKVICLEP
jgi:hypothetical protein